MSLQLTKQDMRTYYDVLGVNNGASYSIRDAYRTLARQRQSYRPQLCRSCLNKSYECGEGIVGGGVGG